MIMGLTLSLLLSFSSLAATNKVPLALTYRVTTIQNGVPGKKELLEKIYILKNNTIWIELKEDKFYASYFQGQFHFFNLVSGTRHPFKMRQNNKLVINTTSAPTCSQEVSVVEPKSSNKESFVLCFGDKAPVGISSHVIVWLADPNLMILPNFDPSIYNLLPTQVKSSNNAGIETKRVLIKQETDIIFKDDTAELWKLPEGKACTSRTCGQLLN